MRYILFAILIFLPVNSFAWSELVSSLNKTVDGSTSLTCLPATWDPADGVTTDTTVATTTTCTATGSVALSSVALTTGSAFSIAGTSTCDGTTTLTNGQTCDVDLEFAYSTGAGSYSDTLTVASDATDSPETVALGETVVSAGVSTACVGYSNDSTNCSASLDAASTLNLGGVTTTVCRHWTATVNGTVSKISVGMTGETYTGTEFDVAWYIGPTLQAYKSFSPATGTNEVDMSTGATGTLTFSSSDEVYYCFAGNGITAGGLERDESVSQPPANYHFQTGAFRPATISYSENTTREVALRLEYTY